MGQLYIEKLIKPLYRMADHSGLENSTENCVTEFNGWLLWIWVTE
jgi:hypothetical protein